MWSHKIQVLTCIGFVCHLTKVLRLAQVLHLMSELFDEVAVVRFDCKDGSDLGCSPLVRFKEEDSSACKGEIMPTAVRHWL